MEEKLSLKSCGKDDVLSFTGAMFKVERLEAEVNNLLSDHRLGEEFTKLLKDKNLNIHLGSNVSISSNGRVQKIDIYPHQWFTDGIDCEVLKLGAKSWQKGKVKIKLKVSLEFCPDEPDIEETLGNNQPEINQTESPLDDIRQMINENSHPHGN